MQDAVSGFGLSKMVVCPEISLGWVSPEAIQGEKSAARVCKEFSGDKGPLGHDDILGVVDSINSKVKAFPSW